MKYSRYARLESSDVILKGDQVRFDTPMSERSQYCDPSLDEERRQWEKFEPVWFGKKFGTFKRGFDRQKIDARRLLPSSPRLPRHWWKDGWVCEKCGITRLSYKQRPQSCKVIKGGWS